MPGAENTNFGLYKGYPASSYATRDFMQKAHVDMNFGREAEALRVKGTLAKPPFAVVENGMDVQKTEVIVPANRMLLSRGNELLRMYRPSDFSFSFSDAQAYDVLKAIQEFALRNGYSFPFTGISCRFARSDRSSSFLSHVERPWQANQLYVVAEFMEYKPLARGGAPASARDPLCEELLKMLKQKFNVRFHWEETPLQFFAL